MAQHPRAVFHERLAFMFDPAQFGYVIVSPDFPDHMEFLYPLERLDEMMKKLDLPPELWADLYDLALKPYHNEEDAARIEKAKEQFIQYYKKMERTGLPMKEIDDYLWSASFDAELNAEFWAAREK